MIMSEEKSSPIKIIAIVFVVAVFVGCESNNYPETANKNEQLAAKPTEPAKPEALVFDPNRGGHRDIEAVIRRELKKPGGEITAQDMAKLRSFHLHIRGVTDISLLKGAINMDSLGIQECTISDLTAVAGMKNLKRLTVHSNRISDLSTLAGLTNLRYLHLGNNQITDLSSLAGLKQLTLLYLTGNSKLTRAEIDKLKQALPNCVIYHDLMNAAELIEAEIRSQLEKPGGEITAQDMAKLRSFHLHNRKVTDISLLKGGYQHGFTWYTGMHDQRPHCRGRHEEPEDPQCWQ